MGRNSRLHTNLEALKALGEHRWRTDDEEVGAF